MHLSITSWMEFLNDGIGLHGLIVCTMPFVNVDLMVIDECMYLNGNMNIQNDVIKKRNFKRLLIQVIER